MEMPEAGRRKDDAMEDRLDAVAEATEMELFGFSIPIKNAVLGAAFTLVTGAAGTIWAAADFMNRLSAQEEAVAEAADASEDLGIEFRALKEMTAKDIAEFSTRVSNVEKELRDNNVAGLQGKLAELGTNLQSIMQQQQQMLAVKERIVELEKTIAEMRAVTNKAEFATGQVNELKAKVERAQKEVEDLWQAMDYLSNPMG